MITRASISLSIFAGSFLFLGYSANAQDSRSFRNSQQSVLRFLEIDADRPVFVSEEDRSENFEYLGRWEAELGSRLAWDSNPEQAPDSESDLIWQSEFSLGYQWWTDEKSGIVLTPSAKVATEQFDEMPGLNQSLLGVGLALELTETPIRPSLEYSATWLYDDGFSNHGETEQAFSLAFNERLISAGASGGMELSGKLGPGYIWSSEPENRAVTAGGSLVLEIELTERIALSAEGGVSYSHFHESASIGSEWLLSVSAEMTCKITDCLTLRAGGSYSKGNFGDPSLDYKQTTAYVALSLGLSDFPFLGLPPRH
ncbi:MAG: hypothetical protein R3F19_28760 [Verrucomicrobiales bacterium]